jgi:hypothetical protein
MLSALLEIAYDLVAWVFQMFLDDVGVKTFLFCQVAEKVEV